MKHRQVDRTDRLTLIRFSLRRELHVNRSIAFATSQRTVEVSRGSDRLVLFTDAILEVESESGDYGLDRLVEIVTGAGVDGKALSDKVLESVHAFAAGRPITDDITFLVAEL